MRHILHLIAVIALTAMAATPLRAQTDSVRVGEEGVPGDMREDHGVMLRMPKNVKTDTIYDEKLDMFFIGRKVGDQYVTTPLILMPDEYQRLTLQASMRKYYRKKNKELFEKGGKEKFDFTDMHFDLGPAEKIFGPGGVQIKTQGSAELKVGAKLQSVDNPSIAASKRNTFSFDFDTKINIAVSGKVGDKINLNLNYNTEATFDFDSQKMKLKYDGKEDETIKLLEAGDVSFPSNVGLINGVSSLFGFRTDLQYGKLKLQAVISQKKSASKSVSSKGGNQLTAYEISAAEYEENRHFFLAHYFRERYDGAMATAPDIASGITIKRIELWVTNKTGQSTNNRNLLAFTDLGEAVHIANPVWSGSGMPAPANRANTLYDALVTQFAAARDISQATSVLDGSQIMAGARDYEKLQSARKLNSNEYTVNNSLGYVSLNFTLQPDEVLAVAFEYTLGGQTYQVGEFATDLTDNKQTLFLKTLKSTANSPTGTSSDPQAGTWRLMMKNIYSIGASTINKDKFRLDVKFQSDSSGVYLTYLPHDKIKSTPLLRIMGLDRLDANNRSNSDGRFDYIEGYTISKGRIIFPVSEPFGAHLRRWIEAKGTGKAVADRFVFEELYDSTKTVAKRIAEKNKFLLTGQFKGSRTGEIDLGASNVAPGSVKVTAGGVTLTENTDYTVDYSMGRVTIINQSILDAGTSVQASIESNDTYAMQRKTMLGFNALYDFSKDFSIGGTFMYLNQTAQTTKVSMGNEPLKNILWGVNVTWKKESQWITDLIDKIPFISCTAPSQISFQGEFAQLIAGQNGDVQGGASYLDDFENTKQRISIMQPTQWMMASVPQGVGIPNANLNDDVRSGMNRALLSWYCIDPIFTLRSSTLTPGHIKSDLQQLSNHYVREVYERELYPNKSLDSYSSTMSMAIMNVAYYPSERGPYNLTTDVNQDGTLTSPEKNWGGMMRKLDANDFETSNIEYMEFWMLDPFIYTKDSLEYSGDLYINLGEVSEDILRDGKKAFESGMPIDENPMYYTETAWGRVPTNTTSTTYAFNTSSGSRKVQDVGLNGLSSAQEADFGAYAQMLTQLKGKVSDDVLTQIARDPANDDYHYYRGSDYDRDKVSILNRYKRINMPEGNSPASDESPESYETAYKTTPDVEDINQDYTLNEYEKFYQYHVKISPQDFVVGSNYIVDERKTSVKLRNGETETVSWYQFRIPVTEYEKNQGGMTDFTSIRFARIYMKGFQRPVILRFATLDLVASDWRVYKQGAAGSIEDDGGTIEMSAVNIEENNDKKPVNYVLPPGISRVTDPSQTQLAQENEQALSLTARNLMPGTSRAVYKNTNKDMRQYKHLQMFIHANALLNDVTALKDGETSVFLRLGSDYRNNYYEYEIPLTLTPEGQYSTYTADGCRAVWPEENMLELDFEKLTALKKERNAAKSVGAASLQAPYSKYDGDRPNNKMTVVGSPTLGEVKTIMIGIRNNGRELKSVEVWVNELRLQQFSNEGGWAAQGTLNLQLSDIGSVNLQGHIETAGFGGLEQAVQERSNENTYDYNITTNFNLGRLLPQAVKLNMPFYFNYRKEVVKPKYNPLDSDMKLDDALEALATQQEKDSLTDLTTRTETSRALSFSGVKFNIKTMKYPMPWDPANFTFNYSYNHQHSEGETTAWEDEYQYKGGLNYAFSPQYKTWEPFKKWKTKSKWATIIKELGFNYIPQSITFDTDMLRNYYEMQERDLDNLDHPQSLPLQFSQQWLWNRAFNIRWDLTKNLKLSFNSATHAEIEEPYTPVDKDRYPDHYQAWKDSVWHSIKGFGTPLDYAQSFSASYKLPLEKLPALDWVSADGQYNSSYSWKRGNKQADGSSLGNTINTQRNINVNGKLNMEKLYNHWDFLKETNKRFSGSGGDKKRQEDKKKREEEKRKRKEEEKKAAQAVKEGGAPADSTKAVADNAAGKSNTKTKFKGFAQEVAIRPDTLTEVAHNQKSKKLRVTGTLPGGKRIELKYKRIDENKIAIYPVNPNDTMPTKVRVNVVALPKFSDSKTYSYLQGLARFLMMIRNVSVSYKNTYNLMLPGFIPNVGDCFGQATGPMRPGLGFAFGFVDDSYIDHARDNGWLLNNDSIATPATSAMTEDLQIKATLEPVRDLKIDLMATRTVSRNKSIQFMYAGSPTTQSGSFNMTTISIHTAFTSQGSADNNYANATFTKFVNSLPEYQKRVEAQYKGVKYPKGTGMDGVFDPANGTVSQYSADVMVPAFLNAYTLSADGLGIFPTLKRLLPNWTINYKGLTRLPWLCDNFKSVTLTHGYKSVFAVGSYNTFASFVEYMGGLGFVQNTTTGLYAPNSMYDVSTVSVNESFSPLIGLNLTMNNNMTFKVEYRKTRVLTLSMTNAQINETASDDFVIGWGWKINNIKLGDLFKSSGKSKETVRQKAGKAVDNKRKKSDNKKKETKGKAVFSHDLNMRFDISFRNQSAINRDIQTLLSEATSGNKALKISFNADYTMSRYVTLSLYFDRQSSTPLLTNNGYPTATTDFGFNLKFSLTR